LHRVWLLKSQTSSKFQFQITPHPIPLPQGERGF
jgi:hypothetical protein